jgi:AAA+ superfamily predicted ATPase
MDQDESGRTAYLLSTEFVDDFDEIDDVGPGVVGAFGAWDTDDRGFELADVRRLARRGVRTLVAMARADERPTLSRLLVEHLGPGCADLGVVSEAWADYDHPNVQRGLDAWLEASGREHRLVGVRGYQDRMFGLAELLGGGRFGPSPGNVARVNRPVAPEEVLACVRCGVYLVTEGDTRTALLLREADPESGSRNVTVQIVSTDPARPGQVAAELRALTLEHNAFRHQVLSFGGQMFGYEQTLLHFHHRPQVALEELILPEATLEAVQRQVVEVARHSERLLAAGQHLKRGVLLHGPPGVGKTHTVRLLMSRLTETTVVQVSGESIGMLSAACSVARALQPAMVVVEDVDLIAEERGEYPGQHPMLFQLLNEMDGLEDDVDVVFVLTTNRPDLLEPALAARPGRVDQAVELTLPDRSARHRLFDLYRAGLVIDEANLDDVLARTEGVTASFLRELLRRAAVMAAARTPDEETTLRVSAHDLDAALVELLDTRNAMTRVLLGSAPREG